MWFITSRGDWLDQLEKSTILSRRLFAFLCFIMLIFDLIGGLSSIWQNEISRVHTARLRIGVLVLALMTAIFIEIHGLGWMDWVQPRIAQIMYMLLMPVSGILLALCTLGGFVAAVTVRHHPALRLVSLHSSLSAAFFLRACHIAQGSVHQWMPPHDHEWIFAIECGCILIVMCILWCACGCTCFLQPRIHANASAGASETDIVGVA